MIGPKEFEMGAAAQFSVSNCNYHHSMPRTKCGVG